ncbi:helix-turn-helix domain-containing protein [Desulfurivibrio sp. D14AmB]|uniref:helix-turn-helix domain-containing protein n=1 Tax=Desulfurivibrio sp. D14AmB TaxID=3374370 RepID=UPI00376EB840
MKTFPRAKIYTPDQIRQIRQGLRDSRSEFARRFLVSTETVKGWEIGRRNQQGPALVIMQQLEAIADEKKRQRIGTLKNIRRRDHA